MGTLGIIGGTGLTSLPGLQVTRREVVRTPYGEPSGPLTYGVIADRSVAFLPRHGARHTIPPHRINYRANIWALAHADIDCVMAVAAVGGINAGLPASSLAIPDQIIDYTWSRAHTYFEDDLTEVVHVDFSTPYCEALRQKMLAAAGHAGLKVFPGGTYAATQGPRLESAAEIDRFERDGCDVVGMTGMPETSLARELGLCYACLAVVANAAAGRGTGEITMEEISANVAAGTDQVRRLLLRLLALV